MGPIRLIVDCDNTLGIPRYEIDDGLVLLYLLGQPQVELEAVTTTFGNGTIEQVYRQTAALLDGSIGFGPPRRAAGIDLYRGAAGPGDFDTPAALALAERVAACPGKIIILALGPLTNLAGAGRADPSFFANVSGIVCMGGYERDLRFARRSVEELNFSCDLDAAKTVLSAAAPVAVMSAQLCLAARFAPRDVLRTIGLPSALRRSISGWLTAFATHVGARGFFLWDLVPAIYALHPARFCHRRAHLDTRRLAGGRLHYIEEASADERAPGVIDLPRAVYRSRRLPSEMLRSIRVALQK